MKNLLICTIVRDCHPHLSRWFGQLLRLRALCEPHYRMYLSVAENDSGDGTAKWIGNLPLNAYAFTDHIVVSTEVLGTQMYPSIWNADRIRNLAAARQKCIDQAAAQWGLEKFDKIAYIEPDVIYSPEWCSELVLAAHPRAAGLGDCPDVYSGWSLRSETHPKESVFLFDTCATRQLPSDTCWDFIRDGNGTWRGASLVPTPGMTGVHANCLHKVWSTFNCFCVYNAQPFIEGARWGYTNRRIDASGIQVEGQGALEADTVAICETFRERGYRGIYLNTNCLVHHA